MISRAAKRVSIGWVQVGQISIADLLIFLLNDSFVRIADIYVFSFEGPLCSLSFESERYSPHAYHGDDIAF
jgi:hypothetical protein